jgi:hypothetical protein
METPASYDSKTLIHFAWIGVIALGIVAAAFTSTILYAVKKAPADKNPSYTLITWLEHVDVPRLLKWIKQDGSKSPRQQTQKERLRKLLGTRTC